jgi:hypothetical protein
MLEQIEWNRGDQSHAISLIRRHADRTKLSALLALVKGALIGDDSCVRFNTSAASNVFGAFDAKFSR